MPTPTDGASWIVSCIHFEIGINLHFTGNIADAINESNHFVRSHPQYYYQEKAVKYGQIRVCQPTFMRMRAALTKPSELLNSA